MIRIFPKWKIGCVHSRSLPTQTFDHSIAKTPNNDRFCGFFFDEKRFEILKLNVCNSKKSKFNELFENFFGIDNFEVWRHNRLTYVQWSNKCKFSFRFWFEHKPSVLKKSVTWPDKSSEYQKYLLILSRPRMSTTSRHWWTNVLPRREIIITLIRNWYWSSYRRKSRNLITS